MSDERTLRTEREIFCAYLADTPEAHRSIRSARITASDFEDTRHQHLFVACSQLAEAGAAVLPNSLRSVLGEQYESAGGSEYISRLLGEVVTAVNVTFHIRQLLTLAAARRRGTSPSIEFGQDASVDEAIAELNRPATDFLTLGYDRLDAMLGGIPPRFVLMLAAASGHGKTTVVASKVFRLLRMGIRVYIAGLETSRKEWRIRLACMALGLDYQWIRSGAYHADSSHETIRRRVQDELHRQRAEDPVWFSEFTALTRANAREIMVSARDVGAQFTIVDHIDCGLQPAKGNYLDESRAVTDILHDGTHEFGHRSIITTQVNRTSLSGGDRFGYHKPIQPNNIFGGDHKRFRADVFLGYYRPLRATATSAEMNAVRSGEAEVSTVLAPHCGAFNCMKHRINGSMEGKIIVLGHHRSMLTDAPLVDMSRARA